jgi:hypothetical protein
VILTAFYNITNDAIEGKHLMTIDELQTPEDIEWNFFVQRVNQTLAWDQQIGYSVQKLIHITQNESDAHIFHSQLKHFYLKSGKVLTVIH